MIGMDTHCHYHWSNCFWLRSDRSSRHFGNSDASHISLDSSSRTNVEHLTVAAADAAGASDYNSVDDDRVPLLMRLNVVHEWFHRKSNPYYY